jgi:predicted acylesterase/phospholipase RssA
MGDHQVSSTLPSRTDEDLAWEIAERYSTMDSSEIDLTTLHPIFQQQLSLALKSRIPKQFGSREMLPPIPPKGPLSTTRTSVRAVASPNAQNFEEFPEEFPDETGAGGEDDWCCDNARAASAIQSFCWPCGQTFCDYCWERHHRRTRRHAPGGLPHEKADPIVAKTIGQTLEAETNDEEQAMLHIQDEDTSWFGAGKDEQDDVVFQDYGRYANLMAERSSRDRTAKYPALVSFVGQTGAGKSSLIRLLIELHCPMNLRPQVPVVGSINHPDMPTSGDVHLYSDPKSFGGEQPVLYADCEGLDGGEREPLGAKSRNKTRRDDSRNRQAPRTASFTKHIRRKHNTSEREILWATTPVTRSREYHVRHLYPRLLYTFSDVIVFVMKNPRVIETVIEQLITWAEAALETSSNQPVLPHAIIVLNACENGTDPALWDVNVSTGALLGSVHRAVHQNHKLRVHAEFWRQLGRPIETVQDLLLSYYSSVRVVRVPVKGRPKLIDEQLRRLYEEITKAAERSRSSKHKLRMLLDSDELQPYLQYAFDHFCRDLGVSFDFVQASFANNPIPSDFGGNILKLAINVMQVWKDNLNGDLIFKELSFIVASCIMLESARHRTLGPAQKVFPEYIEHADDALDDFCDRYWPCEYVGELGRCVNVRAGHTKGHQLKSGQIFATGQYISSFSPESYRMTFRNNIYSNLAQLLHKLQEATQTAKQSEMQEAANIHRSLVLCNFYKHLGGTKRFDSHTACLSCLISPPEHPLPCGHVLCGPCVRAFGTMRGRTVIEMKDCPLHPDESDGHFETRWPITIKPPGAGSRILTLDGGGVRGIVELTILQQIEKALGHDLPIQLFFDLICGTSTGGIIALGLGAMGWSVRECTTRFDTLCEKAFTRRKGGLLPVVGWLVSAAHQSRYETQPLETALRSSFKEELLFGGFRDLSEHHHNMHRMTKVAVTTTTTSGTVCLLANYNRTDKDDHASYNFLRSEKAYQEIKIWEAARATSAAPMTFKPFDHEITGQIYQDGAIYHNNPIELAMRERKLMWPDMADTDPDVIISIGTGFNPKASGRIAFNTRSRVGMFSGAKQVAKIAVDHVQSTLNSERTWRIFHQRAAARMKERYIRLNVELDKDPPKHDDVNAMSWLPDFVKSKYQMRWSEIKSIADRLLATLFYLELTPDGASENEDRSLTLKGAIVCRFAPGSQELRALGNLFRKRSIDAYNTHHADHNPCFKITERHKEEEAQQLVIGGHVVDKMIRDAHFSVGQVQISLSNKMAEVEIAICFADQPSKHVFYPISGFPRCLLEETSRLITKPRLSSSLSRRRTPTHANRGEWQPSQTSARGDPIERYGATNYLYPGDATSATICSITQRFNSPDPVELEGSDVFEKPNTLTPGYDAPIWSLPDARGAELPAYREAVVIDFPDRDSLPPRAPVDSSERTVHELAANPGWYEYG